MLKVCIFITVFKFGFHVACVTEIYNVNLTYIFRKIYNNVKLLIIQPLFDVLSYKYTILVYTYTLSLKVKNKQN